VFRMGRSVGSSPSLPHRAPRGPGPFPGGGNSKGGSAHSALRPTPRYVEVPRFEVEDKGLPVRVGQKEEVLAGSLRVKVDPGPSGQSDTLDIRAVLVADQQDERASRPRILELHVDLARGRLQEHLETDRGYPFEHQVLGQVAERRRHDTPTRTSMKTCPVHR
jgi:hypothetical protein